MLGVKTNYSGDILYESGVSAYVKCGPFGNQTCQCGRRSAKEPAFCRFGKHQVSADETARKAKNSGGAVQTGSRRRLGGVGYDYGDGDYGEATYYQEFSGLLFQNGDFRVRMANMTTVWVLMIRGTSGFEERFVGYAWEHGEEDEQHYEEG
jgi:hypothetical protein